MRGKKWWIVVLIAFLVSVTSCTLGAPSVAQTPEPDVRQSPPVQQPLPIANYVQHALPTDLMLRGVGRDWYVGTPMGGQALYLVAIDSGVRRLIAQDGGWGTAVLTETAVYWIDNGGHIQAYDILSEATRQLTAVPAERFNLAGNGRWLVWQDKRNEQGDANYYAADIYAYDLLNEEEIAVAVADGVQQQPVIWENTVVWSDNRNSPVRGEPLEGCGNCSDNPFAIYAFDLLTGETAVLVDDGKHNAQPTISNGRVAWIAFGVGVRWLDLERKVVETAVAYQNGLNQIKLINDQLFYAITQACDVIIVNEAGNEHVANTGLYRTNIVNGNTIQLTAYKEPHVLYSPTSVLIGEGCMTGYDAVYLLPDTIPGSLASVRSNDPQLVVTDWSYIGANTATEFLSASEEVRVLDEAHYQIRLIQTDDGFELVWGDFHCSTQPVLLIQPDSTLEFWPGEIVGEDCDAAEVGHKVTIHLETPISLSAWKLILHLPEA